MRAMKLHGCGQVHSRRTQHRVLGHVTFSSAFTSQRRNTCFRSSDPRRPGRRPGHLFRDTRVPHARALAGAAGYGAVRDERAQHQLARGLRVRAPRLAHCVYVLGGTLALRRSAHSGGRRGQRDGHRLLAHRPASRRRAAASARDLSQLRRRSDRNVSRAAGP